ncbi:MAG: flagellar hook-length control protein FliK, partial [Shewanella sp.]
MESIPLINTASAQLITSGTSNDATSATPRPIPAEVQVSPEGDSIILNGTEYNLKLVNAQQRQALIVASSFLVNPIPTESSQTATPSNAQLVTLGAVLTLKLPDAIAQLAQQNGISLDKLYTLAARPQGYPLPNVTVTTKEFQFANGTVIPQDPGTRLSAGEYQAKISLAQGRPILVLTPILSKLEIQIGAPINETQLPIIDKQAANVVVAKTEPAQIIATFLRKLETLTPQTDTLGTTKPAVSGQATSEPKVAPTAPQAVVSDITANKTTTPVSTSAISLQANTEPKLTVVNQKLNPETQSQDTAQTQQKSASFEVKLAEAKNTASNPLPNNPERIRNASPTASSINPMKLEPAAATLTTSTLTENELPLNLKPQAVEAL